MLQRDLNVDPPTIQELSGDRPRSETSEQSMLSYWESAENVGLRGESQQPLTRHSLVSNPLWANYQSSRKYAI